MEATIERISPFACKPELSVDGIPNGIKISWNMSYDMSYTLYRSDDGKNFFALGTFSNIDGPYCYDDMEGPENNVFCGRCCYRYYKLEAGGEICSGISNVVKAMTRNLCLQDVKAFGYSIGDILIGKSGDMYIVGTFEGTVDFGKNWGGNDPKTSAGYTDVFITKINADGSYGWTKRMGGSGIERFYGSSINDNGDIYLVGGFENTVNFAEDWDSNDSKTSGGYSDAFLLKINSDGSYGWVKKIGDSDADYGKGVAVDSDGNVYIAGEFGSSVDLGADWGVSDPKTSNGVSDIFIIKVNFDGTYGWGRIAGGSSGEAVNGIALDDDGNIYVVGNFGSTSVDFAADFGGSDTKGNNGGVDGFIMKLHSDGTYVWTKVFGGSDDENTRKVVVDKRRGIVYFVGNFKSSSVDFGADWGVSDVKNSNDNYSLWSDIFVTKINSDDTYAWTKTIGSDGNDFVNGVIVSDSGDVYITGTFGNTVNFAKDWDGLDERDSNGGYDAFLLRINYDGSYGWVKRFGGAGSDSAGGVSIDKDGDLYMSGSFDDTLDFAKDFDDDGDSWVVTTSVQQGFLLKIKQP